MDSTLDNKLSRPALVIIVIFNAFYLLPVPMFVIVLVKVFHKNCEQNNLHSTMHSNWTVSESRFWPNMTGKNGYNNSEHINCIDEASIQNGVIVAVLYGGTSIFAIPMSWCLTIINSNLIFVLGLLLHVLACVSLSLTESFQAMAVSAAFYSVAVVVSFTSCSCLIAQHFREDVNRLRFINLCYLAYSCGIIVSLSLFVWLYTLIGHFYTLSIMTTIFSFILLTYTITSRRHLINFYVKEEELVKLGNDYETIHSTTTTTTTHKKFYYFLAFLAYLFTCVTMFSISWVGTTTPNWLQQTLHMTTVETGLILSVSSTIDVVILFFVTITVRNNLHRWICLLVFTLIQAFGSICYPFVTNPIWACIAEAAVRNAKGVILAQTHSLIFRIIDDGNISNYSQASSLYILARNVGFIVGSVIGPLAVIRFGFDKSYWCLGTCIIPLALTSIFYQKLSK